MPTLTLSKDVDILARFATRKSETRRELTGLHVGPDFTEATDSYTLARISKPLASETCIIDLAGLPKAGKEAVQVEAKTIDDVYPDTSTILTDKPPGRVVRLNEEYLERAAKAVKDFVKVHGQIGVGFDLFVPDDNQKPLRLSVVGGDDVSLEIMVMPIRV